MRPRTHITRGLLERKKGLEKKWIDLFSATFGDEAEITRDTAFKALNAGIPVWDFGFHLPEPARTAWLEAREAVEAEYERVTAPARSAYAKANVPAWDEYRQSVAAAWTGYERIAVPGPEADAATWDEFKKAKAAARDEYEKDKSVARARYERAVAPARSELDATKTLARAKRDEARAAALVDAWKGAAERVPSQDYGGARYASSISTDREGG